MAREKKAKELKDRKEQQVQLLDLMISPHLP